MRKLSVRSKRRVRRKEESLAKAKQFAEVWYLKLRGKKAGGELLFEMKFSPAADRLARAYELMAAGCPSSNSLRQIALITPPAKLILYVVQRARKSGSMTGVTLGTMPHVFAVLAMVAALIAFPQIALMLPDALQ